MKCACLDGGEALKESCPARGTWIEIVNEAVVAGLGFGRAPQGARGLKFVPYAVDDGDVGKVVPRKGHVD